MANQITVIRAADRFANPRILTNRVNLVGNATKYESGTGTVTAAGDNRSIVCDIPSSTGRCFNSFSVSLVSGHHYVAGVRLTDFTASNSRRVIKIMQTPSAGSQDRLLLTSAADGIYAIAFTASATATVDLRVGFGLDSADGLASATFSGLFFYETESLIATDGAIPKFVEGIVGDNGDYFKGVGAWVTEYADVMTSTGRVTETAQSVAITGTTEKYRVGICFGDSYSNGSDEWPAILAQYGYALFVSSWPAYGLAYFDGKATEALDLDSFPDFGDATVDFCVIQSSVNAASLATWDAQTQLNTCADLIRKAQLANKKVFVTNAVVNTTLTDAKRLEMREYNAALQFLCSQKNAVYIDICGLITDPDNRNQLLAAYDAGDNIHPSAAASIVIADAIDYAIQRQRAVADTIDSLTSRYRSVRSSGLTSSLTSKQIVSR